MKYVNFVVIITCFVVLLVIFFNQNKIRNPVSNEYYSNTGKKNLVLITSVINTVASPLAYANVRSVFSKEDRIQQTKFTIQSVRKKIPNSYIVIIEGSEIDIEEFDNLVDNIYFVSSETKTFINGKLKGLGETAQLLDYFKNNEVNINTYKTITKLSGRYYLNDHYNFNSMPLNKICAARENPNWIFTSSYRLPGINILEYIVELNRVFNIYIDYTRDNDSELSLESVMFNSIDASNIYHPKKYGVSGYISVNGDYIESFCS